MKKKSIVENLSLNLLKTIMCIIFPLVTYPYAARVLGETGLGKVSFAESIIGYFSVFSVLGINTYGIRELSKVRDDKRKLNDLTNQLFSISMINTVFIYAILIISIFKISYLYEYRWIMLIQSIMIICTNIGMDWFFTALEEYRYITIRAIMFQVISFFLLLIFVKQQEDYLQYAAVCVFATAGSGVMNFIYIRKFVNIKFVIKQTMLKHLKPIWYIFGTNLATSIYLDLDRTMLGIWHGDAAVGLYAAASKITKTASTILSCITNVMLPRVSYSLKNESHENSTKLILDTFNYTLMLVIPMSGGIICLYNEIIQIMFGIAFIGAGKALAILSVDVVISSINRVLAWVILVPHGYENKVLITTTIGAVSNLVMNFMLIPRCGIEGAAVATCISEITVMLVCIFYCKKIINIYDLFKNFYQYVIPTIMFMLLWGLLISKIRFLLARILLQIFLAVLIYGVSMVIFKNSYCNIIIDWIRKRIGEKK